MTTCACIRYVRFGLSKQDTQSEKAYALAREQFAALGVDTHSALAKLSKIPVSLHCWQGDDVGGFEPFGESLGGGLAVTGNYLSLIHI